MSEIKDGGPAFPQMKLAGDYTMEGASLRDYFAAHIIAGMAGSAFMHGWSRGWKQGAHANEYEATNEAARIAYDMADRMLRARETT